MYCTGKLNIPISHTFNLLNPIAFLILSVTQSFKSLWFSLTCLECHFIERAQPFSLSLVYTHPSWQNMIDYVFRKNRNIPSLLLCSSESVETVRPIISNARTQIFFWQLEKSSKISLISCMTSCRCVSCVLLYQMTGVCNERTGKYHRKLIV